jgi:hypothetical protein
MDTNGAASKLQFSRCLSQERNKGKKKIYLEINLKEKKRKHFRIFRHIPSSRIIISFLIKDFGLGS